MYKFTSNLKNLKNINNTCDAMTAIKREYCKMSPVTLSLISGGVVSKQISLLLIGLPGFHQL